MDTFVLIAITGVGLGALFFLVASGLSLIYGLMGVLNFAHGTFLVVGAFSGLWISTKVFTTANTWTFLGAMIFGGIAGGVFALIVERLVITRLYERHIEQALVTVGVALVVGATLSGWFGNDPRLIPTPHWFINTVTIGKAFIPVDRFLYIGASLVLFILLSSILRFTRIGLIIRAGVENRAMVGALGINVRLAFSAVFFLGGFAAGLGGVLVGAYQSGVTPLMSGSWLIYGFIVVVVGGMGSLGGSALAALLIGVVDQFTNYYMPGLGDFVIVFLLAAVLLTRPQGLLGKVGR
jgi:branched-chain amino acid transport system permease protein